MTADFSTLVTLLDQIRRAVQISIVNGKAKIGGITEWRNVISRDKQGLSFCSILTYF